MTKSRSAIESQFAEIYAQREAAKRVLAEKQSVIDRKFAMYLRVAHKDNVPTEEESASRDAAYEQCEKLFQQLRSLAKAAPYAPFN